MTKKRWRLAQKAEDDLLAIFLYGAQHYGETRAATYVSAFDDLFDLIAANPKVARMRDEIIPPVRIHPHQAHLVIYEEDAQGIVVLRIRHASEDWGKAPV